MRFSKLDKAINKQSCKKINKMQQIMNNEKTKNIIRKLYHNQNLLNNCSKTSTLENSTKFDSPKESSRIEENKKLFIWKIFLSLLTLC